MKVSIDFDITPEELRKLFGLPDVEGFQQQLMEDLRERVASGAEGYDPVKLFQPYISGSLASWDLFQKFLVNATNAAEKSSKTTTRK
ncbi:hypothetical protein Thimo_2742 [Thioflavicoccus mobilis 8321]|uniref:Uncharacterized protein n=1 Tax=Thioflavicoccus mobilis 8321 TaxID=765912 RepID=L0H061_9GAMM|nr:DUF6489 family protein [Thioflavicoccus mobilis]AGA91452.1 hypothetical protein Thimo_2742 [Thioflavicoccus mobilis 8321]